MLDEQTDSITLYEASMEACDCFANHLMTHTLPSAWNDQGCGWQQLWTSKFAGVHASCDGLLFLDEFLAEGGRREEAKRLGEKVFHEHLCVLLDSKPEIPDQRQELSRLETISTTLKLSKFLQASTIQIVASRRTTHSVLLDRICERIQTNRTGNGWPASLDVKDDGPCVFATVEAVKAFALIKSMINSVEEGLEFLLENLRADHDPVDNLGKELMALSGLSSLLGFLSDKMKKKVRQRLLFYLNDPFLYAHQTPATHFHVNSLGRDDYYTINATYVGARAAVNLIQAELLPSSTYMMVIEPILEAIHFLRRFVLHWPNTRTNRYLFWEQTQAAGLLTSFIQLATKLELKGLITMHVAPTHFHSQRFIPEKDLIVILMPLGTDWANDVHDSYRKAVQSKGYRPWRSDNEFRDDNIVQTIWAQINKCRAIVADCTGRNPNVFYELGVAHTIGKPVFMCVQNRKDIPFDIAAIRSFAYGTMPSQIVALESAIKSFLDTL